MNEGAFEKIPPLPLERPEDSPENRLETETSFFGNALNTIGRLQRIFKDPQVREAATACLRTIVNGGISVADAIMPGGELLSWAADIGKFADENEARSLFSTNLTPDVNKSLAVSTEALELITLGAFPSHFIETAHQFKADKPRILEGFKRALAIYRDEQDDYAQNREVIDEAVGAFAAA